MFLTTLPFSLNLNPKTCKAFFKKKTKNKKPYHKCVGSFLSSYCGAQVRNGSPSSIRGLKCPGGMLVWPGGRKCCPHIVSAFQAPKLPFCSQEAVLICTDFQQLAAGRAPEASSCSYCRRRRDGSGQLRQAFFCASRQRTDRTPLSVHVAFKPDTLPLEGVWCFPPRDGRYRARGYFIHRKRSYWML